MKIVFSVIFIFFGTHVFCQYFTNTKESREKAIRLYNEYVRGDTLPYRQIERYTKTDSAMWLDYTSKNVIKSILIEEKINDNSYTETLFWFSHGDILHIYIFLKVKNKRGRWRDKGSGSYIFLNNQVLYYHEEKLPHQNVELLINKSRLLYVKGLELLKNSN